MQCGSRGAGVGHGFRRAASKTIKDCLSMEEILGRIADIESQLSGLKELVKEESKSISNGAVQWNMPHASLEDSNNKDWIESLKRKDGPWIGKPLVVLSLFDGIGGIWVALSLLNIPYIGYSAEVNPYALQVLKNRHPIVQHLGDVRELKKEHIKEHVDLVVGGFPCQDLSWIGKKIGLHGERSKLFFELLRVLKLFKPTWFLAENVASMHWVDRDEISKHLGCLPIEIDSQELSANKRRRFYWTNIPHPRVMPKVGDQESTTLQHVLDNATALEQKLGCILGANPLGSHVQLQQVLKNDGSCLRHVSIREVEQALGFPDGYTDLQFIVKPELKTPAPVRRIRNLRDIDTVMTNLCKSPELTKKGQTSIRWCLVGNSFSVRVIAYLLSPLLDKSTCQRTKSLHLPEKIAEEDCSAMDVGEVWALYNMQQLPNWYAVVQKRSGDRFSPLQKGSKKSPLRIEVTFLEMTSQYASGEVDKWNPRRGAGLYQIGTTTDIQESWLSFSHRTTGFIKIKNGYFFYPRKGEVWALYQLEERSCPWFVLVTESKIDRKKVEIGKPGQEGFKAWCRILQLTVQTDVFRVTGKEVVYSDLRQFAFMVPYFYKNEASLLKLEFSNKGRRLLSGRKRKRHTGYGEVNELDEEDSFEEDEMEEDARLSDVLESI